MYLKYRLRKGIKFYLYSNLALAATWIFLKSLLSVSMKSLLRDYNIKGDAVSVKSHKHCFSCCYTHDFILHTIHRTLILCI